MSRRNLWGAWVFALLVPLAACADEPAGTREALRDEELERELDLALQGDTLAPTFEDTAVGVEPEAESPPTPARQAPRTQPRETPSPPAPTRAETRPETRTPSPEPRAPAPRSVRRSLPVGTTFAIHLDETLSTDRNQPGDGFTATVQEPVYAADGSVLIPSGARIRGRVTAVDASDRVGETAMIKLSFESIAFNGGSYPLNATVVQANPERRSRTTAKEHAVKIGAGAAAGAILGQVLGKDTKSTLKGAAIGAAAGTAIAMGTSDVDAVLPAGSRMVIRLDGPIEVVQTIG